MRNQIKFFPLFCTIHLLLTFVFIFVPFHLFSLFPIIKNSRKKFFLTCIVSRNLNNWSDSNFLISHLNEKKKKCCLKFWNFYLFITLNITFFHLKWKFYLLNYACWSNVDDTWVCSLSLSISIFHIYIQIYFLLSQ